MKVTPETLTYEVGVKEIEMSSRISHVHISGFYGDEGENEGVLSVIAALDPSPNFPSSARIFVGSPVKSALIEGYIPNLGAFSCSPEAAERLIAALQRAVTNVRAAVSL